MHACICINPIDDDFGKSDLLPFLLLLLVKTKSYSHICSKRVITIVKRSETNRLCTILKMTQDFFFF